MKVRTGYIYHIKDTFFDVINDNSLMINHENGRSRPTYFTIKDKNILWFIPLRSKVLKYQKIVDKKIEKYGSCKSIMISEIAGENCVILLQNAFPTLEKYIDHPHIVDGKPLKVIDTLKDEILENFKYLLALKKEGRNLFFTDIDAIKEKMLLECN
ncbi:MAG: type III toxin-antitoxin system CptIN family toxin [Bacilli bacterium]